ncbi:MAG: preprotein translocase subunit SecD [Oscillospiraceae bacterium]
MKKVGKPIFFVVFLVIAIFTVVQVTGLTYQYGDIQTKYVKSINDIRWGIDIRGGVDVTFTPPEGVDATKEQMDAANAVISQRLITLGITDSECYTDYTNQRIIVRFPWQSGEENFDPEQAVKELGETALLTFRFGTEVDAEGLPTGITSDIQLEGTDVESAVPGLDENNKYVVYLNLTPEGTDKFYQATKTAYEEGLVLSIWMDETIISAPNVEEPISSGRATIRGSFTTAEEVTSLANKINSGALPFKLQTSSFSTISPTLGLGARDAMAIAGAIAFVLIAIYMICVYRLPGAVATVGLLGQVAGMICAVTGFFGFMNGSTLTVPGIAGIILSVGMGVDANIITNERIKEELRNGKSLDGALSIAFQRGFTAIFDSNITVVFVAIILMGAFGVSDSFFATLLSPVFRWFGASTEGTVYSLGFTLIAGIILNFVMAVTASKLMLLSLSRFKALRNPVLYGGVKKDA